MNYSLSRVLLSTIILITFVQSEPLCITNGKTSTGEAKGFLNGEYIQTGISNNKPYYTLNIDQSCGSKAAVLQYTGSHWRFAVNDISSNSHFAICNTDTKTPQQCTSWDAPSTMATTMTISSGSCTKICSKTLQITNSGTSKCNGEFVPLSGDIFKNSNSNLYWYFNRNFDTWYCSTGIYMGCSVSDIKNSVTGYNNINTIGSCTTDTTSTTGTTTPTTTTTTTTTTTQSNDNDNDHGCGVSISGKTDSNTFVNGNWIEKKGKIYNGKPYYTKDGYYIFFMSGCNLFNDWIIARNLYNAIDENICHNNNNNIKGLDCTSVSCNTVQSFYGRCRGNKQKIEDCDGLWQFPENQEWVVDNSVKVGLLIC